jgi:mannonate dehydratase
MHLALTLNPFVDTDLLYAQQLGVDWIVGDVPAWDYDTLAAARNRVEKSGLVLCGLVCLPAFLVEDALSGRPDGEEALARICRIVTDVGKLDIPSLGYQWPPADPGSSIDTTAGRGGALSAVYVVQANERASQHPAREEMWHALSGFLQRVLPVAEVAGVRLVYRTDISLLSLPEEKRILDSVADLDRLFQVAGSPYHGLDLDHGFITQVLGPRAGLQADEVIRHFGRQRRIFAVRMRNLRNTESGAQEHFLDEDRAATLRALLTYRDAGFEGPLSLIPSPGMADDTEWGHKGYAFGIGYLRALLQATR